jgi:histidinol-phosphate aminotransferase
MYRVRSAIAGLESNSYGRELDDPVQTEGLIDCALGTNPFGHSRLIDEEVDLLKQISISDYPKSYEGLKDMITSKWRQTGVIGNENIVLGAGAIDCIVKVNRVFIEKGTRVLGVAPQFPEYAIDVRRAGGCYQAVPLDQENNCRFSADQFLTALNQDHSLIHLENPNNPTGQVLPVDSIRMVAAAAKKQHTCLVVDEAYGDYLEPHESAVSLINEFDNLVVIRSFSKGYGLAAMRVGYLVASALISRYCEKAGVLFSVNAAGLYLSMAAMRDQEFLTKSIRKITERKQALVRGCVRLKVLETDPRVPIMVLEHPDHSHDLEKSFLDQGILTVSGSNFEHFGVHQVRLRVPREMTGLIEAARQIDHAASLK